MFERLRSWFGVRTHTPNAEGPRPKERFRARLQLEKLEDRAVPALLTVTSAADDQYAHDVEPGDGIAMDNSGRASLRAAIEEANASAGADTIWFDDNVLGVQLTQGQLDVTSTITISGGMGVTISRASTAPAARIFEVTADGSCSMFDLQITGGEANRGGGIKNSGWLYLSNCELSFNFAVEGDQTPKGGAVYNLGSMLAYDSTFRYNAAVSGGGAIVNYGTADIGRCLIEFNSASVGGGIETVSSPGSGTAFSIWESFILDNTAQSGGGIFTGGPRAMEITSCLIKNNSASIIGGGLYNGSSAGTLTVAGTEFQLNSATVGGGGAYLDSNSTTSFDANSGFYDNTAPANKGNAIFERPNANVNNQADMGPAQFENVDNS